MCCDPASMSMSIRLESTDEELLAFAGQLGEEDAIWAELIRLQTAMEAKGATAADRKRVKVILKQHRGELLGALDPFVRASSLRFQKGFLDGCALKYTISQSASLRSRRPSARYEARASRDCEPTPIYWPR